MKISKVVISCFKKDLHLLRACIGSIYYWHPDITIFLLKDESGGKFDTVEIEENFGVKIFTYQNNLTGWGWGKVEVCINNKKEKLFVLDTDVILLGNIVDYLNQFEEDFIVTGAGNLSAESYKAIRDYVNTKGVVSFDPEYKFPGYGFNTGQMVVTTGLLNKGDFLSVMDFGPPVRNKYPDALAYTDQGVLNYVLVKQRLNGRVSIRYEDFWIWPGMPEAEGISLADIKNKKGLNYVLHWAGLKPVDIRRFKRYDLFDFYEREYYKKIRFGSIKRLYRRLKLSILIFIKITSYVLRGLEYPK
jgi:lipopolysaccharide biosynthesis glycosyltransferase